MVSAASNFLLAFSPIVICKEISAMLPQSIIFYIYIVRTNFDTNPKTGMDLGPTSPNNKFVESRRKS